MSPKTSAIAHAWRPWKDKNAFGESKFSLPDRRLGALGSEKQGAARKENWGRHREDLWD
jgi:hypothetical protein